VNTQTLAIYAYNGKLDFMMPLLYMNKYITKYKINPYPMRINDQRIYETIQKHIKRFYNVG